ncbi:MAG: hypothetical protein A3E82_08880 [Gammaproteobacteria bacterium RIFCSPHIGHO2_12_FULL_38_11]|nr:MAG: hypothetical protein A3E82_08880 [Gammaproteobacteria bacterium RIFCSPHIGHO2_12_FULL_38_11]
MNFQPYVLYSHITGVLYWLLKAIEYKPDLADSINFDEYLRQFDKLDMPSVFNESNKTLLMALNRNDTIRELTFDSSGLPWFVNAQFADYLAKTKTLTLLSQFGDTLPLHPGKAVTIPNKNYSKKSHD